MADPRVEAAILSSAFEVVLEALYKRRELIDEAIALLSDIGGYEPPRLRVGYLPSGRIVLGERP